MRTYAAELLIFHPSEKEKKERLGKFFNYLQDKLEMKRVDEYLVELNHSIVREKWYLQSVISSEFCSIICCDFHHENYKYNVCLENHLYIFTKLLKEKMIDCCNYQQGLPNEKKWLVFPKFKSRKLYGYEFAIFSEIFQSKYIFNSSQGNKDIENFKIYLEKYWQSLLDEKKLIEHERKDDELFLSKVNSCFAKKVLSVYCPNVQS